MYSYAEDCMVTDPLLAEHLAHWGINIMQLEKSDKTVAEMNLDANLQLDWSRVVEDGEELVPVHGPGLKGLVNLGSTCYMNSILQAVCNCIPEVRERYLGARSRILETWVQAGTGSPAEDLPIQLSKIAAGILTDAYTAITPSAIRDNECYRLTPLMFKHLIGGRHPEFSGGRQQDAAEYFSHLLECVRKAERAHLHRLTPASSSEGLNLPDKSTSLLFHFLTEKKLRCSVTGQVKRICNAGKRVDHQPQCDCDCMLYAVCVCRVCVEHDGAAHPQCDCDCMLYAVCVQGLCRA